MTEDTLRAGLTTIRDQAEKLLGELPAIKPPDTPGAIVRSDTAFETVLLNARPGDKIVLGTELRYGKPLKITKPVILESERHAARIGTPMTLDEPAPMFLQGLTVYGANDTQLRSIDVRHVDRQASIVTLTDCDRPTLDRPRILGHPTEGGRRGVYLQGTSDVTIRQPYIDDIGLVGKETQAVYGHDIGAGVLLDGGRYSAASQAVMFGGGDAKRPEGMPRGLTIRGALLTKKPEWYEPRFNWQIKCALELKAMAGAVIVDSVLEYAGTSEGQAGYAIVLTVRNQDGMNPWATVQDVAFERVLVRHACGGASFLGYDDIKETKAGRPVPIGTRRQSVPMERVAFRHVKFEDIDPLGICKMKAARGSGRLFFVHRGPKALTFEHITAEGQNLDAIFYGEPPDPPKGLVIKDWKMPPSRYGFASPLGTTVPKLKEWAPDAFVEVGPSTGAVGYPTAQVF